MEKTNKQCSTGKGLKNVTYEQAFTIRLVCFLVNNDYIWGFLGIAKASSLCKKDKLVKPF